LIEGHFIKTFSKVTLLLDFIKALRQLLLVVADLFLKKLKFVQNDVLVLVVVFNDLLLGIGNMRLQVLNHLLNIGLIIQRVRLEGEQVHIFSIKVILSIQKEAVISR